MLVSRLGSLHLFLERGTSMDDRSAVSIFLVDDNSTFLCIVRRFLKAYGALEIVGATCGGEESLGQIQALQPDIVLIDPFAIDASGLEGVAHLREAVPEAGIIVTTLLNADGTGDGYRQAVLGAGADDFVPKDMLAVDLLPAIGRVLRTHRYWEEEVATPRVAYAAA
jgi:DNA-binding NarL/FixJ family response regulator